jgi:DNA-directed RNA polymerase sigma subunit (sigma70/sigma32)
MNTQQIIEYRLRNPCLTLEAVGKHFGISRQRVHQILVSKNQPTKHYIKQKPTYKCLQCGKYTNIAQV